MQQRLNIDFAQLIDEIGGINRALLNATGAGKAVNNLAKAGCDLSTRARALVDVWRVAVTVEKKAKAKEEEARQAQPTGGEGGGAATAASAGSSVSSVSALSAGTPPIGFLQFVSQTSNTGCSTA